MLSMLLSMTFAEWSGRISLDFAFSPQLDQEQEVPRRRHRVPRSVEDAQVSLGERVRGHNPGAASQNARSSTAGG